MLSLLLAIGLLLVGTILLIIGADWFLDGAGDLGRALGVSALVLGVLLAGLEPEEMLTAAIASARGAPPLPWEMSLVPMSPLSLRPWVFQPHFPHSHQPKRATTSRNRDARLHFPVVLLFLGMVTQLEGVLCSSSLSAIPFSLSDRPEAVNFQASEADDDDDAMRPGKAFTSPAALETGPVTFGGLAAMAVGGPAHRGRVLFGWLQTIGN